MRRDPDPGAPHRRRHRKRPRPRPGGSPTQDRQRRHAGPMKKSSPDISAGNAATHEVPRPRDTTTPRRKAARATSRPSGSSRLPAGAQHCRVATVVLAPGAVVERLVYEAVAVVGTRFYQQLGDAVGDVVELQADL